MLSRWKPRGKSLADALATPEIHEVQLVEMLERGVNRTDFGGSIIVELGYSWSAWNGVSSAQAGLSVRCGAFAAEKGVPNAVVVNFPNPSEEAALYERATIAAMVGGVVRAWSPEWAVATSDQLRRSRTRTGSQPIVGWMTYLGSGRPVPKAIPGAEVTSLGDGTMVVVAEEWAQVTSMAVGAVADELEASDALRPLV